MNKYLISDIFLILGIILTIIIFLRIVLIYLKYKNIIISLTGYDISKKIIDNYEIDDIDIIESQDNNFNIYNLRRKVIKLSTKTYYNKDIYNLSKALELTCCSIYDNNHKDSYTRILKKIFTNFNFNFYSSLIAIVISYLLAGTTMNTLGLILLVIIFSYQYIIKTIQNESFNIALTSLNNLKELTEGDQDKIKDTLTTWKNSYDLMLIITIFQLVGTLIFILF